MQSRPKEASYGLITLYTTYLRLYLKSLKPKASSTQGTTVLGIIFKKKIPKRIFEGLFHQVC